MESKTTSTTIPHRAEFINHSTYLMPKSASLSRQLQSDASVPHLFHSLHETKSSVLSLAANDRYIFSGNQNEDISVRSFIFHERGIHEHCPFFVGMG